MSTTRNVSELVRLRDAAGTTGRGTRLEYLYLPAFIVKAVILA